MADAQKKKTGLSRRSLLIGGGAGVGLLVGWAAWPRSYEVALNATPDETVFNAFLKISSDGGISVIVPQAEMGQGVMTSLPQALADELGADWRTVAVETAPISPLYANWFIATEGTAELPAWLQTPARWMAKEVAIRSSMMITGGSTSIRGFEQRYREAGAVARVLMCMAAAEQWGIHWEACETADGFVTHGKNRLRFGELAAKAATLTPPDDIQPRPAGLGKISGQPVPRIDLPSKVDGTARYAGDVRLPDMLYASIRYGPFGTNSLASMDKAAADAVRGVVAVVDNPGWVAAVASNWWAAEQGVQALDPQFKTDGPLPDDVSIAASLATALKDGKGKRFIERGDPDAAVEGSTTVTAEYDVPLAPHAPMEPLTATARVAGGRAEVWMPTQGPAMARSAIARALGLAETQVTIYPMLVGGGFGRKIAVDAGVVAAILSSKMRKPVQLTWSRAEETGRDDFRPPARARMAARVDGKGRPLSWSATIATPSSMAELFSKLMPGFPGSPDKPEAGAIDGALPAYQIPSVAAEHRVAQIGVPTGMWRSVAHSYTAFFNECFMDELARRAGIDPMSYRMQMLGSSPRLARCLTTAASLGNWQGGVETSGQGIAAHSSFGSHVAMLADIRVADGNRIIVDRIVAAVDCGRVIHPDIVRQQVEGGIVWGLSGALGDAISVEGGRVTATNFDALGLPILSSTPEIIVEILENSEDPGGVGEIAVPPVAPAIANAVFAATGKRLRKLPLNLGNS